MLLLVGLGNPGAQYAPSRHNIGFQLLDHIASQYAAPSWKSRFDSLYTQCRIETEPDSASETLTLLKPTAWYNESGRSVRQAVDFWKIPQEHIIVFHDDIDLAPGKIRMKQSGGHAGNNGMRSIISHIGANVRRVRIGVGHPGHKDAVRHYVLSAFAKSEHDWHDASLRAISKALPLLALGEDARFQCEVMRLAPPPKAPSAKESDNGV